MADARTVEAGVAHGVAQIVEAYRAGQQNAVQQIFGEVPMETIRVLKDVIRGLSEVAPTREYAEACSTPLPVARHVLHDVLEAAERVVIQSRPPARSRSRSRSPRRG